MSPEASGALARLMALAAGCVLVCACASSRGVPVSGDPPSGNDDPKEPVSAAAGIWRPLPHSGARGADLVLALNETIDPSRAPMAATYAERVVFANLYETLIRLGGKGELQPGLARRWESLDDDRRWRLHLREDARLWDGTPVTASLIARSWRRNADLAAAIGRPFAESWSAALIRNLSIDDEHTMTIVLSRPWPDLPLLLAHPDLAVAIERSSWLWPLGSGPCRLSAESGPPLPDIVCRPNPHHQDRPSWASLTFRVLDESDARELMDGRTDLAVFRGWRAAAYFDQLDGVQTSPLPWDRIYLLLIPPASALDRSLLAAIDHAPATLAASIPWNSLFFQDCHANPCPFLQEEPAPFLPASSVLELPPASATPANILHLASDRDARALADRLAAFIAPGYLAAGVDPSVLSESLRPGHAACYVVGLEAMHPGPCLGLSSLLARAPWLNAGIAPVADPCLTAQRLREAGLVWPLAATRAHLVWCGPMAGLKTTHDGVPLVASLGHASPPEELP